MSKSGWIGVDLDGTLAHYNGWVSPEHVGEPVPAMAARVRRWLKAGRAVKIFTARVSKVDRTLVGDDYPALVRRVIQDWTEKHFGVRLEVTCEKDFGMVELWDDRCVQVIPNTGRRADGK